MLFFFGLSLLAALFFVSFHHFPKLTMLPKLFLLLLFPVNFALFALFLGTTSSPGNSIPTLIFKNGLVVNVFECGNLGDEGLAIMSYFFVKFVILKINHRQFWHFLQHFRNKILSFNHIVRDIQSRYAGTIQQSLYIIQTL